VLGSGFHGGSFLNWATALVDATNQQHPTLLVANDSERSRQ
jgi:hypothetical protein